MLMSKEIKTTFFLNKSSSEWCGSKGGSVCPTSRAKQKKMLTKSSTFFGLTTRNLRLPIGEPPKRNLHSNSEHMGKQVSFFFMYTNYKYMF